MRASGMDARNHGGNDGDSCAAATKTASACTNSTCRGSKRRTSRCIDPALPIIDPHHHLWDRDNRYLFDDLLDDTESGHNIRATVYIQCRSMFRADGPVELQPIGETEFVNGVAAMSASGHYGDIRACAGIISYADFRLGRARAQGTRSASRRCRRPLQGYPVFDLLGRSTFI